MIDALLHNIKGDYMIWIIGTGKGGKTKRVNMWSV